MAALSGKASGTDTSQTTASPQQAFIDSSLPVTAASMLVTGVVGSSFVVLGLVLLPGLDLSRSWRLVVQPSHRRGGHGVHARKGVVLVRAPVAVVDDPGVYEREVGEEPAISASERILIAG